MFITDEAVHQMQRDWEDEQANRFAPAATMSEAHAEWHRNTGLEYGCPQDACHPPEPDFPSPTQTGVKCGNAKHGYGHGEGWAHHATIADVRWCYEISGRFDQPVAPKPAVSARAVEFGQIQAMSASRFD